MDKQTAETLVKIFSLLPKELPDEIPENEVPKCKQETNKDVIARIRAGQAL